MGPLNIQRVKEQMVQNLIIMFETYSYIPGGTYVSFPTSEERYALAFHVTSIRMLMATLKRMVILFQKSLNKNNFKLDMFCMVYLTHTGNW